MSSVAQIDQGAEEHDPLLYHPTATARSVPNLDEVSEEDIAFYEEAGYLSVAEAFSKSEVEGALHGLMELIAGKNPEFTCISFEAKAAAVLPQLTLEERADAVRKLMFFTPFETRLRHLAYHPALLRVVERILGEPAMMFQDMALLKPPRLGREKPWHQDKAYFDFPIATKVVGVWVALDQATIENGCMQVLHGGHRDGPRIHFKRRDWQICDGEIMGMESVAAPLLPGGLLLFDGLLPHGTPTNHTAQRRRALQFHYAPANVVKCSADERLKIFGSEGKDVSC